MPTYTKFAALILAPAAFALALTLPSSGRDQGKSPTNRSPTNRSARTAPTTADVPKSTWNLPPDADKTKNPQEATEASIATGRELYMTKEKGNCVFCHGETGAGNKDNLPRLKRVPADLSDPERMPKLTDGELFWKISKGIPGIMPAGEKRLSEEERWHLVNFVRTLPKAPPQPSTITP